MPTVHPPLVYYARRGDLIKIGTSIKLRQRMVTLKIDELLAVEPGSYNLEAQRHEQFADDQVIIKRRGKPNEWYRPGKALVELTQALRAIHGLPDLSRREVRQLTAQERASLALLPPLRMKVRPFTLERFAAGLTISTDGACWYRKPEVGRKGYGRFYFEGRLIGAHAASYVMFAGPVPKGFDVDHLCHDRAECDLADECPHRACVNPAHLEPKSRRDHQLRAFKTHCKRRHLLTEENTYRGKDGRRQCKVCVLEAGRAKSGGRKCGDAQRARTRCKNGHKYTPENTYVPSEGKRNCKICRRETQRRHQRKRKAARQSQELRTLF